MSKKKMQKKSKNGLGWLLLGIMVVFIGLIFIPKNKTENISFPDLHGLSFSSDGTKLVAAVHDGLREYNDGKWTTPDGEKNDYMGYSPIKNGFYSSGHPGPTSSLKNPLGIVKSQDNGKTIDVVDLHGEVDFHSLTVGYETEDLYVYTPEPNSKMKEAGFYYSKDKAKSWNEMALNGLTGNPRTFIAHPTQKGVVVIGTDKGLYLSNDYGESFQLLSDDIIASTGTISSQDELIVGQNTDEKKIIKIGLNNKEVKNVDLPKNIDGNIMYITNNYNNPDEIAIATDQINVYVSKNNGADWESIVNLGKGINQE